VHFEHEGRGLIPLHDQRRIDRGQFGVLKDHIDNRASDGMNESGGLWVGVRNVFCDFHVFGDFLAGVDL
jgi:hypothetical protein